MAGWLEELERFGSSVIDATTEGVAARIKSELNPDAPDDPTGRPETQYDTTVQEPVDGPESMRPTTTAASAFGDVWAQYKWWIVGGAAVTGYLFWQGGR